MENEKKCWLIEQYAHKAWTVSLTLAQEAARAGEYGKGYAVVAHEARTFADKLLEYAAKIKFDNTDEGMIKGIADFAIMINLLAINAALEIQRMAGISMDYNIPKSMTVFADELRRIAVELNELTDKSVWQNPFIFPELASRPESAVAGFFFFYSIGGNPLTEYMSNIQEVCYPRKSDIEKDTLSLRGSQIPIVNCYKHFNLPYTSFDADRQTIMIINPDGVKYGSCDGIYAVPIDDSYINAIVNFRAGRPVPPKKGHAFADCARECWDVICGDQVVFPDWKKLIVV